jgi:hypothetical protein
MCERKAVRRTNGVKGDGGVPHGMYNPQNATGSNHGRSEREQMSRLRTLKRASLNMTRQWGKVRRALCARPSIPLSLPSSRAPRLRSGQALRSEVEGSADNATTNKPPPPHEKVTRQLSSRAPGPACKSAFLFNYELAITNYDFFLSPLFPFTLLSTAHAATDARHFGRQGGKNEISSCHYLTHLTKAPFALPRTLTSK